MIVTGLTLRDFRNYEHAELELAGGLTVVHGPNGAGKTNLLEALYASLTGRSCRTNNERELVRAERPAAHVSARVAGDEGRHTLEVGIARGQEKRIRVDGSPLDRSTPPPRPLVCVFLPDRLELVKGAPAVRRAHLDQVVAALWPARASTRGEYARALAQRNALIGQIRSGRTAREMLDPWDVELARVGITLTGDRRRAIDALTPVFASRAAELGLPEPARLEYRPRSRAADATGLRDELRDLRDTDITRGFTTHGPHRDDLVLVHGERPLRSFGSQGQQRAGLLALLFAERDLLASRGQPPLLLLDDVMSELDAARRERLAELVRGGGQTLITTTELDHVPRSSDPDTAVIRVLGGTLTAEHAAAAPA